jgi:uncharacterized MAPEG superfamily protein
MSTELVMLVWSAVLCVVLALPYTIGLTLERGLPVMVGNREAFPQPTGWLGRSLRAHRNMVENLAPFAALVLVAHAAGAFNAATAFGARLFFWARLVHGVVYTIGIPWVRTLAFVVSVIGEAIILVQLL